MKVATFGCSWTHGQPQIDNHYNWPLALKNLHPDWTIHNYAVAGSSLAFQVQLMDKVCSTEKYDLKIFQFTTVGRLTFFDDDIDYMIHFKESQPGFKMFDIDDGFYRKLTVVTPGHTALNETDSFWDFPKDKRSLVMLYYKHLNRSILRIEHRALIEYAKSRVDFCFFHNEDTIKFGGIPVILDIAKAEKIENIIADKGEHLNKLGIDWQTNWIDLQLRNII